MLSLKEFTEFITRLSVNELYKYQKIIMDETYTRIDVKGPKSVKKTKKKRKFPKFELLPWKITDRLPGNANIMKKLGWYHPSVCSGEFLESQVKVFAKIMKQLEHSDRILASIKMFELFDANQWYLKENPRFLESIVKKLDVLAQDPSPIANSIASNFSHFRNLIPMEADCPPTPVKLCPKTVNPTKTVLCDDSDSEPEDTTPFSRLPWDSEKDLPKNFFETLRRLEHFEPEEYDAKNLENQLQILSKMISIAHGRYNKLKVVKYIFNILDKNDWYIDTHLKFGAAMLEAQHEFEEQDCVKSYMYDKIQDIIANMHNPDNIILDAFTTVPQEPFSKLPWEMDELPNWHTILMVLKDYKPVKCSKEEVVKGVRLFLYIVDITKGIANKLQVCRHLFNLLAANEWFMKANERFHKTVVAKLDEFKLERIPEAVKLANDFAYFRDLTNDEDTNLEPLIPTDSDYEAEGDPLGTNGDSLPYPKVTKEQLDREIDRYMAARQAHKIHVKSNYLGDSDSSS